MENIAPWLLRYKRLGYSFFNTGSHEKRVYTKWEEFQNRKPTDDEIRRWLTQPSQNYAIVCGEISNLVVFDVDTKNGGDPTPFLNKGLFEMRTPSGGYHFYTTYNPVFESTKHKKSEHDGILRSVDVQSNKSLVFAPPSKFPNLPAYTITNDVPVTPLPDDLTIQVLEALKPEEKAEDIRPYRPLPNSDNRRPGDIFNALASWDDVLLPLGWKKIGNGKTGTQYWKRPDKKDFGISASTNYKGWDLFFAYTKFYDNIQWKKGYTKFSLYTLLNHNGDPRVASRTLVYENYKIATKQI
jgi:hypothetical protein